MVLIGGILAYGVFYLEWAEFCSLKPSALFQCPAVPYQIWEKWANFSFYPISSPHSPKRHSTMVLVNLTQSSSGNTDDSIAFRKIAVLPPVPPKNGNCPPPFAPWPNLSLIIQKTTHFWFFFCVFIFFKLDIGAIQHEI